jgi:DnaJ family protein C protein 28
MVSTDDFGDKLDWTAKIAERKIQDAMKEGLFDNLPGRGEPLDLSQNPFEPPGMGTVNRLLRHNKVLPMWLLLEQEIEASRALALGTLARWEAAEPNLRGTNDYSCGRATAREAYARHMKDTNDLILKYNYSSPFAFRAPIPFLYKHRLAEFDAQYRAAEDTP